MAPYPHTSISLAGKVGGPDGWITASGVAKDLARARAGYARSVLVKINSIGGEANAAFDINASLRLYSKSAGRTVAYVPRGGGCFSAATILALGCDYIICDPEAKGLMIHAPTGSEDGSITNSRSVAEGRLISLYAERTFLGSRDAIAGLIQCCGDTRMTPRGAVDCGFADEVGDEARATKVARALAQAHPCWPGNVSRLRCAALHARGVL